MVLPRGEESRGQAALHGPQALVFRRKPGVAVGKAAIAVPGDDPSGPQQGKGQNAALQVLILMGSGGKHRRAAPIPLQHGKGAVGQNRAHRKGTLVLLAVGYPVKGNVRQAFRRLDAGVHQQPGPVILCLVLHFIADFQVGAAPLQGQAQRGRAIHRFFRPAAGRKVIALGEGQVPGDHAALAESFLPPFPHRAPQLGGADGRLLPRLVDVAVAPVGGILQLQEVGVADSRALVGKLHTALLVHGHPEEFVFQQARHRAGLFRRGAGARQGLKIEGLGRVRGQVPHIDLHLAAPHVQNAWEVDGAEHIPAGRAGIQQGKLHRRALPVHQGKVLYAVRVQQVQGYPHRAGPGNLRGVGHRHLIEGVLWGGHMLGQNVQPPFQQVARCLGQPGIVVLHVGMDLVPAAPADGVVGVVLHQPLPQEAEVVQGVGLLAAVIVQHGVERLQGGFQHILGGHIGGF